jgi:outer membrane protein insertion porin family
MSRSRACLAAGIIIFTFTLGAGRSQAGASTPTVSGSTPTVTASTAAAIPPEERDITAGPWMLGEIAFTGLVNVKQRAAMGEVQAKPGIMYHRAEVNRDIQALLGMGNFERVSVDVSPIPGTAVPDSVAATVASTNTVRLTYIVTERPTVKKIKFEGNQELSAGSLTEDLTLKEGDPYDEFKAKQDTNKLLDKYHDKGFADATVNFRADASTTTSTVDVTFLIHEGKKTHVVAVIVDGAHAFSQKKVGKQMDNHPGWLFSTSFKPSKLEDDLKEVDKFYKNHGYLDFKIIDSTYTLNPDGSEATIHLKIEEGRQYRFGKTTFAGSTMFTDEEFRKALTYTEGKVFDQEEFQASISAVQEMYADKGHLKARVTPEKNLNAETGWMDVALKIEEGPIVKVGHVDVEGNHATKSYVLKREVVTKPGDTFSAAKVRKSQQRLMNLGFLDNVDIDLQPTPGEPESVDLTYTVLEGKPGMLTAGAGLSSLDGLVGTLSLSHLNVFGKAQRVSIAWQFGARVQDFQVSWTEPWVGDSPTSLGVDLFNTHRVSPFQQSFSAYTDQRTGGRVRLGPRFEQDKYLLNLNYTYQTVTLTNVASQFSNEIPTGPQTTSAIGAEFARDTRDNIWDPTTGTKHAIGVQFAGGPLFGEVEYYRPTLSNAWHYHLFSVSDYPFVLSFFHRLGFISNYGSTPTVPIFERFFIGGQDTLRGYAVNGEVGPPDGANIFDVANVEFRFPLAREHRRTIVAWVFFFDVGGSWKNVDAINWGIGSTTNDFKTDVGMGIRFTTPAFPIRLDWGWGLNHRPGESKFQVNFGLGNLF